MTTEEAQRQQQKLARQEALGYAIDTVQERVAALDGVARTWNWTVHHTDLVHSTGDAITTELMAAANLARLASLRLATVSGLLMARLREEAARD